MAEDLDAGPVSLLDLLQGEREYHAPLFQRRYIWAKKDIDRLWQDIESILDGIDTVRFLGALVVESRSKSLATDPASYWIIDGQQRLTTLYLFLANLVAAASQAKLPELADDIARIYMFNQSGSARNQPKLKPTLLDQRQMNDMLKSLPDVNVNLPTSYGDQQGRLATAYRIIRSHVRTYCRPNGEWSGENIEILLSVIVGQLRFVQIVLKDKQQVDPNQVFDSLNTTGQPLENKDLIRNEVFRKLSDIPETAQSLYENSWIPLEERLGDRLEGYFFPFTLIEDPTVTKSAVLYTLRERWNKRNLTPQAIIQDLEVYVPAYDSLTSVDDGPRQSLRCGVDLKSAMAKLVSLGAPSSVLPFAIKVVQSTLEGTISEADAVANLKLIESFLVRRGFLGLEPTGLHAVFKGLWTNSQGIPIRALETIEKSQTIRFPKDEEFQEAVQNEPLYRRTICNYVLMQYEMSLVQGDPPPPDTSLTADHIAPQNLTPEWEALFPGKSDQELIDTWANLVPLSAKVNSEKQRRNWEDVQGIYETETYYRTPRRLAKELVEWNPTRLRERAERLSAWAVKRWPRVPS